MYYLQYIAMLVLVEHEPDVCPEGQWHPGLYLQRWGQQDPGTDHPSVLGAGEATPPTLRPVLGLWQQEGH